MKWQIVNKPSGHQPLVNNYRACKPQLAKESKFQCVYCCIHESRFGGIRNFHVEHYRPQSKFRDLTNCYANLFYACGVCNIFKSDDWPQDHQDGDFSRPAYPDPSKVDYGDFIQIDSSSGQASSATVTGKYVIERLNLNRPQIVGLRSLTALFSRIKSAEAEIERMLDAGEIPSEQMGLVVAYLLKCCKLLKSYADARPYGADQLQRPQTSTSA